MARSSEWRVTGGKTAHVVDVERVQSERVCDQTRRFLENLMPLSASFLARSNRFCRSVVVELGCPHVMRNVITLARLQRII